MDSVLFTRLWWSYLVAVVILLSQTYVRGDVNGGSDCAACTIILSLAEQKAEIHNETVIQGMERLCTILPASYRYPCQVLITVATPIIEKILFEEVFTPDVGCHALGFCYTDPGQEECHIFPKPKHGIRHSIKRTFPDPIVWKIHKQKVANLKADICDFLPGLKGFCQMIEQKLDLHLPVEDFDGDKFSTIQTLRGTHFRGKDCDDVRSDIHPGRRPLSGDSIEDSNCNGIYGTDKATGATYEELFCSDVQNYGVAILGDSAGAHFSLPREWFSAVEMNLKSFEAAPMIIADEFDWPHLSAVTGYKNSSLQHFRTESLYLKLRETNRCNHRDYQNIGVNGAKSRSMNNSIQYTIARNRSTDNPLIVIYSLIGNDVCNGHEDTIKDMTLPEDMKKRFTSTLEYLDTQLPKGSHVFATGLADGRVLYNTLKDQIHPIGDWRQDVTYPMVYTYLGCLEVSPCAGWMTTNETLRNFTSERAANLSLAVKEIAESFKAKHFTVHYADYDITTWIKQWVSGGGKASELIEPVDGFHPSQVANVLFAEALWDKVKRALPEATKRNPHNADIQRIFGDQGGH